MTCDESSNIICWFWNRNFELRSVVVRIKYGDHGRWLSWSKTIKVGARAEKYSQLFSSSGGVHCGASLSRHKKRSTGGKVASVNDTSHATASATQPVDQQAVTTASNTSSATMATDWLTVDRWALLDPRLARWLLLFVSISSICPTPFIRRPVLSTVLPPNLRSPAHTKQIQINMILHHIDVFQIIRVWFW